MKKVSIFFSVTGKIYNTALYCSGDFHPSEAHGGGGVFGENGWKSALLQTASPIIGHNRKKDAS